MLISRSFTSIEDYLLEEFTNETFHSKDARVVKRDGEKIYVECTTGGWQDRNREFEIKDEIIYRCPDGFRSCISADFSINKEDRLAYYRFLLENNVNPIRDLLELEKINNE